MIQVESVEKHFRISKKEQQAMNYPSRDFQAVQQVSFNCAPGRVFALLGPNGAGKTTMLRLIATILKPNAGNIIVNGYNTKTDLFEVRKQIGFLTGSTNLYERLNAHEVVKYFAELYGMSSNEIKVRKELLFDQLQIHSFASKKIGELSTGMKQRVSIVRSMIHNPAVLIFDEPTSGLDVITAHHIIELIRQCKSEKKTIIFSSHIMSEVELLCDDLAIMANGKLIYNNTMEAFRSEDNELSLTERFIQKVLTPSNIMI